MPGAESMPAPEPPSLDFHLDFFFLGFLRLGETNLQHAVLEAGAGLFPMNLGRQLDAAAERAVRATAFFSLVISCFDMTAPPVWNL